MRKPWFVAAVLTVIALSPAVTLAQGRLSPAVTIKGAPMLAQLSQGDFKWRPRKGLVGGVSLGGVREGRFALSTEVLYARRGASNLGANAILNVLEVPVLMRVNVSGSKSRGIEAYGIGGAALDVNLLTNEQQGSRLNLLDPNVIVGAGVAVQRLSFEARQNLGLRSLAPNTPGLKSRSFSFMVGYRVR